MAKADYERAKSQYPSTAMGEAEWVKVFDANPDIMWKIIGDIYDAVKTEQEKEAGIRRMGRRPARQGTSMEEVYRTIFPQQYSMEPFPVALAGLLKGRSQRQFAPKVPVNQATISRLLSGQLTPDMVMLERIALAAKVPPHYFVEYRALFVGSLITRVLTDQPNMGVSAVKRLRAARSA